MLAEHLSKAYLGGSHHVSSRSCRPAAFLLQSTSRTRVRMLRPTSRTSGNRVQKEAFEIKRKAYLNLLCILGCASGRWSKLIIQVIRNDDIPVWMRVSRGPAIQVLPGADIFADGEELEVPAARAARQLISRAQDPIQPCAPFTALAPTQVAHIGMGDLCDEERIILSTLPPYHQR